MKTLTQKDRIIRHLNDKGSITALEAHQEYGIMRLTSRICELRNEGYNIRSEFVSAKNRYNEPVSFSKYSLVEYAEHTGINGVDNAIKQLEK